MGIIPEQNAIFLLPPRYEWHTTTSVWARRIITRWRWYRLFRNKPGIIEESPTRTGNTNWRLCELCVLLAQLTSDHLTFIFPVFESVIRCSRNDGPPGIWFISLYLWYRVYFVIIIVEFSVTVLSMIYLRNMIWGWTVPLTQNTILRTNNNNNTFKAVIDVAVCFNLKNMYLTIRNLPWQFSEVIYLVYRLRCLYLTVSCCYLIRICVCIHLPIYIYIYIYIYISNIGVGISEWGFHLWLRFIPLEVTRPI